MGALGEGFAGAAASDKSKIPNIVATQGFGRFQDTMKFVPDTSEELGMGFEE